VTLEELGATAVFLASPAAAAISGETLHVDAGYHAMGM
jgi:enoyl-[acyl-carrier protein] reductase I